MTETDLSWQAARSMAKESPPVFCKQLPEELEDPSSEYQLAKEDFFSCFLPSDLIDTAVRQSQEQMSDSKRDQIPARGRSEVRKFEQLIAFELDVWVKYMVNIHTRYFELAKLSKRFADAVAIARELAERGGEHALDDMKWHRGVRFGEWHKTLQKIEVQAEIANTVDGVYASIMQGGKRKETSYLLDTEWSSCITSRMRGIYPPSVNTGYFAGMRSGRRCAHPFALEVISGITAIKLLRKAERPIVYKGEGVVYAGAVAELKTFVERASHHRAAKGAFSEDHPLFVGVRGDHTVGKAIDSRRGIQSDAGLFQPRHFRGYSWPVGLSRIHAASSLSMARGPGQRIDPTI